MDASCCRYDDNHDDPAVGGRAALSDTTQPPATEAATESLIALLDTLSLEVHGCRREIVTDAWSLDVAAGPLLHFYAVEQGGGRLWLEEGERSLCLSPGDAVLLPSGRRHALSSRHRPAPPWIRAPARNPGDPQDESAALTVLHVRFSGRKLWPFALLPPVIHLNARHGGLPEWLQGTLAILSPDFDASSAGHSLAVNRAAEILFVHTVLSWGLAYPRAAAPRLHALREPGISIALAQIHRHPTQAWSVASLAAEAGMSRAAFAARFNQLVGMPPKSYLLRYRIQHAASLLRGSDMTLAEVAERTGYSDESALAKAFKRQMGTSPGRYRRETALSDGAEIAAPPGA